MIPQTFRYPFMWLITLNQQSQQPTFLENFARDPLANGIAVAVLAGMVTCVIAVAVKFLQDSKMSQSRWPRWTVPVLAILGAGVASYLLYVDITGKTAVCGPTGDCNAVQDSPYAKLFGMIPVGLLGLAGYLGILAAWLAAQFGPTSLRKTFTLAVWGMTWFGIVYSIYLTFLEPFVIGATCIWCITSAILISLIYLAATGPAKEYLTFVDDEDEDLEYSEA